MPRPGPRPYECVRRAWHSDRHQPVRGSLIREILRVANEIHSPATRKNKEWQEKLPSVVLKAEEIMYSKANSEAEYVDLKTLWERANDAIDTIIRRDDTNESGDLLQPCIEAALNLGCIPRRASRSQRHSNPRCYLSSSTQEAMETSASSLKFAEDSRFHQLGPAAHLLPLALSAPPGNLQNSRFAPWCPVLASCSLRGSVPAPAHPIEQRGLLPNSRPSGIGFISEDCPPSGRGKSPSFPREACSHVYPLYYGDNLQNVESCSSFQDLPGSSGNKVDVGSLLCISDTREIRMQNFLGSANTLDAWNETSNLQGTPENPAETECNLSLQLGLPSTTCLGAAADDAWSPEVEDVGSSSSRDGSKFHELSPSKTKTINFECSFSSPRKCKDMCSFRRGAHADEPLESCSSKRSSEEEGALYVEPSDRKHRVPLDDSADYGYLHRKQKLSAEQSHSRGEKPDL